jgi:hypothetical protein
MKKMIRFIAVTILVLFVTSLCFAQENTKKAPIEIEKKGLGYRYTYQDKPLKKLTDFFPIMENSPEAVSKVKKARASLGIGMGFSIVGGFLIGWPIGQALANRSASGSFSQPTEGPYWYLAGVGGGLVVVGVVFGVRSNKQLRKGVDIYNESIVLVDAQSLSFELALTLNRINLNLRF